MSNISDVGIESMSVVVADADVERLGQTSAVWSDIGCDVVQLGTADEASEWLTAVDKGRVTKQQGRTFARLLSCCSGGLTLHQRAVSRYGWPILCS